MKRRHVCMLVAFVLALTYFQLTQDTDQGSTYSFKGRGSRGFFTFLSEYYEIYPWLKPWKDLSFSESGSVLFVVSPSSTHVPVDLFRWIEQGNTVIAIPGMSAASPKFIESLAGAKAQIKLDFDTLINLENWPESSIKCGPNWGDACIGVQSLTLPLNGLENISHTPEDSIVAGDKLLGTIKNRGKGRVIVLADSNLISNDNLDKADNAKFLYQLATQFVDVDEGLIYFDEFHHGYTAPAEPGEVNKVEAMYALTGTIILVVILGALSRSVRIGKPIPLKPSSLSESVEFCTAMGLLIREKCPADALPNYLRSWRLRLEKKFGVSRRLSNAEALAELDKAGVISSKSDLAKVISSLESGNLSKLNAQIAALEAALVNR